jgi:hypothetical protein
MPGLMLRHMIMLLEPSCPHGQAARLRTVCEEGSILVHPPQKFIVYKFLEMIEKDSLVFYKCTKHST